MRRLTLEAALLGALAFAAPAVAQEEPEQPVEAPAPIPADVEEGLRAAFEKRRAYWTRTLPSAPKATSEVRFEPVVFNFSEFEQDQSPEGRAMTHGYRRFAQQHRWHGIAEVPLEDGTTARFSIQYDRQEKDQLNWVRFRDEREEAFVRKMREPKARTPVLERLAKSDDDHDRLTELAAKHPDDVLAMTIAAAKDSEYNAFTKSGKKHHRVGESFIEGVTNAFNNAGENKTELAKALTQTHDDPLLAHLALELLVVMNNPNYGFRVYSRDGASSKVYQDLKHQRAGIFLENIKVIREVMDTYEWARPQTENWVNFVYGVLPARFSNEEDVGGRRRMFDAMKILVGDAKTIPEAMKRAYEGWSRLFRFFRGYGRADANMWQLIEMGADRCETDAMAASLFMRVMGVPNFDARTPSWGNRFNNHAWNHALFIDEDGEEAYLSFLGGEVSTLPDGSPNLHAYDPMAKERYSITVRGTELLGSQGMVKMFITKTPWDPQAEEEDATTLATTTRDMKFVSDGYVPGQRLFLNVVNYNGWSTVDKAMVKESGTYTFHDVGIVPQHYHVKDKNGNDVQCTPEGALVAVSTSKSRPGVRGVSAEDIRSVMVQCFDTVYAVDNYEPSEERHTVTGLSANREYQIAPWTGRNSDELNLGSQKFSGYGHARRVTTDENGSFVSDIAPGTLMFILGEGTPRTWYVHADGTAKKY